MTTPPPVAFRLIIALGVLSGLPGRLLGQVPTQGSEPRLAVPRATVVTQAPGQPTISQPAPASADTTPPAPGVVSAPSGGVTQVGSPQQATASSSQAATASYRSYGASKFYLELGLAGGVAGTYVHQALGGEPEADIFVGQTVTGGGLIPKHVTNVKYTDIVAQVGPTNFTDLIRDLLQGKYTAADGRLVGTDFNLKAQTQLGFSRALLTGVDLPALDVSSKDAGYLTIHLAPELAREEKPGSVPMSTSAGARQQQWLAKNFSLTVSGLGTSRVTRIEPFSIKVSLAPDQIGVNRELTKHPAKMEWDFLQVTLSGSDVPGWMAWRDDFLVNGNHLQANERSLVLTLLSSDLKTPLLELDGSGVGLVTLRRLPSTSADAVQKYQAELYVQQWSVGNGSSKGN